MALSNASFAAFCPSVSTKVNMKIDKGDLKYDHTINTAALQKKAGNYDKNMTVRGLTAVSPLKFSVSGTSELRQTKDGYCVAIKDVNVYLGFESINVYIDNKYKKNSCAYKVIKDHENYHVAVFQQGVVFYQNTVRDEIKEKVRKLKSKQVRTRAQADALVKSELNKIMQSVMPTVREIDKKLREKNAEIDTPESYKATEKLCPLKDW